MKVDEMEFKKNQILETDIIDVNMMGLGVAKVDGAVVFVQNAVTGDRCQIKIIKCSKKYYVARIEKLLFASPDRVAPQCDHFKRCGGCNFQHISYDLEKNIKKRYVESCLKKANLIDVSVLDPISCDEISSYRNKGQFPVGEDENGKLYVGFYSNKSHDICRVDSCSIQDPVFLPIADFLCKFFTDKKIRAYQEETGEGLLRHIYLRRAKKTGEIMLCLVLKRDELPFENELICALTKKFSEIKSIVLNINAKNTNVILGNDSRVIYGDDKISDVLLGTKLALSHRSFYQVNHDATELLYSKAFQMAETQEHDMLIDLFCGIGSIALTAPDNVPVVGVEIIPQAVEDANKNAIINKRKNTRFICGDANTAFDLITSENSANPLLIVDPPRKGISSDLIEDITESKIQKVLYISCGPDTLARDLKIFQNKGFSIGPIQPVDLFPRTGHIENIVCLTRKDVV